MLLNCIAVATMHAGWQGSATPQTFVPAGVDILTKGVKLAKIDPGDEIATYHCSSLLERANVEHGLLYSPYRLHVQASGPSYIVVFSQDFATARTALRPYVTAGHISIVDQENVAVKPGYKSIPIDPSVGDQARTALVVKLTSDFVNKVGDINSLEIRGIALRQRKYFLRPKDHRLSIGYDVLVTAREATSSATFVYHIQSLADSSLTNWNRTKVFGARRRSGARDD